MVNYKSVTINNRLYTFCELSHSEAQIFELFFEYQIEQYIEALNCIEDILVSFTGVPQAIATLRDCNFVVFRREFQAKSQYRMHTMSVCKYTTFNLQSSSYFLDRHKAFIQQNSDKYIAILVRRGLPEIVATYFVNAILSVQLSEECLEQLEERLQNINTDVINKRYQDCLIGNGESAIKYLNGISERQQQKNLNIKHTKLDNNNDNATAGNDNANDDNANANNDNNEEVQIYTNQPLTVNQFYLHTNNFNRYYYIEADRSMLFLLLLNSKQYIQAFLYDDCSEKYLILTRDKKIENNSKNKYHLRGGDIEMCPVPLNVHPIEIYNVDKRNAIKSNIWYIPFYDIQFGELQKLAYKTVTMNKNAKYYEFHLLCNDETLHKLLNCAVYKFFYIYERQTIFDVRLNRDVVNTKLSIYVYYLDVTSFVENVLQRVFDAENMMITTREGIQIPMGILYTTYLDGFENTAMWIDNVVRFLYMKTTNSMHPYPTTSDEAETMTRILLKTEMAFRTNSKIDGTKYIHDGAMGSILSERGLPTAGEKRIHDIWFNFQDSRSSIIFNEKYMQNCQNPALQLKFATH